MRPPHLPPWSACAPGGPEVAWGLCQAPSGNQTLPSGMLYRSRVRELWRASSHWCPRLVADLRDVLQGSPSKAPMLSLCCSEPDAPRHSCFAQSSILCSRGSGAAIITFDCPALRGVANKSLLDYSLCSKGQNLLFLLVLQGLRHNHLLWFVLQGANKIHFNKRV